MTYADDHASPEAPFAGDETGAIFDHPDLVLQSPTTAERIVDTQSGFIVVIKHLGKRLSLSVRRRIGTPPASSILLTADESVKLSNILTGVVKPQDQIHSEPDQTTDELLAEWQTRFGTHAKDAATETTSESATKTITNNSPFEIVLAKLSESGFHLGGNLGRHRAVLLTCAVVVALTSGIILADHWRHEREIATKIAVHEATAPTALQIDKFARNYVSNLLDFSQDTYRFSQIQAMSLMTPELMAKYWTETNFPIPQNQLPEGLKRENLVITNILQEAPSKRPIKVVDVMAEFKGTDDKPHQATHLQLKIDGQLAEKMRVVEQEDLSASHN